jgi:hypothetical protein
MEVEQVSRGPISPSLIAVIVREQRPELRRTHRREDLAQAGVIISAEGRSGLPPRLSPVSLWRRGRYCAALIFGSADDEQKRAGQAAQSENVPARPSPRSLASRLSSAHRTGDTRTRTRLITTSRSRRICASTANASRNSHDHVE